MKTIAVITARGGSKRIPKKNIKEFMGKPIIAYSIETAINSKLFDEVMVSTDNEEIAKIALKYGAKVPFIRSEKNSDDYSTTVDVILEVLNKYKENGKEFDYACCIYPTAPFITCEKLISGYNLLINHQFDSVIPVVKFSYPIQRALKIENNKLRMFFPDNILMRSQDLEHSYHDAGQFYFINCEKFLKSFKLIGENSSFIEMNEIEVQDIDTMEDWRLAEVKYKILNKHF